MNSLCSQVVSRVALRNSNGWAVGKSLIPTTSPHDTSTNSPSPTSFHHTARAQSARSLAAVLSSTDNLERLVALHAAPQAETTTLHHHFILDEDDYAFGSGAVTPRQIRSN